MRARFLVGLFVLAAGVLSGSLFLVRHTSSRDAATPTVLTAPEPGNPSRTPAVVASVPPAVTSDDEDVETRLQAWHALPDDPRKAELAIGLGFELASINPLAALARVTALPESHARASLLAGIVQTWAAREPHAAAAWTAALSDGRLRAQAAGSVVLAWSSVDAAAATRWVAGLRGAEVQPALQRAVTQWSGGDPEVAGRWVAALPPGVTRERATSAHVQVLLIESPAMAAAWLDTLPAAEQPLDSVEAVAREWLADNPAAARAWLERTALPLERRQRLNALHAAAAGVP